MSMSNSIGQRQGKKGDRRSANGPNSRGGRMRSNNDKPGLSDGIYANVRMTHSATSIVGCVVQVQVRNGGTYEGILKTFSSKLDIVLEKAHKLDDVQGSIPSKDRLIETVIFRPDDVVTVTAASVELDYANKDTFTDAAVNSKYGSPHMEKELQPWEADASVDGSLELEADGVTVRPTTKPGQNGWDPNDMFQTNLRQFNVQSSWDPNMAEYTTPLQRDDNSKEFRDREARAAKLASEIEGSDAYRHRIELENGDEDEEARFSAVVREDQAPRSGGGLSGGKLDMAHVVVQDRYVPPALRTKRMMRPNNHQKGPNAPGGASPSSPSTQSGHPPLPPHEQEPKVNGDKEEKGDSGNVDKSADIGEKEGKELSPPLGKGDARKPQARERQIKELKEFSSNFKLSENETKDRERKNSSHSTSPQPQAPPSAGNQQQPPQQLSNPQRLPSPQQHHQEPPQQQRSAASSPQATSSNPSTPSPADKDGEKKSSDMSGDKKAETDKISDTVKKSTLNPMAKEFVLNPNAKVFTPKQPAQVATPPRPSTQSPGMPMMPQHMPGLGQPMYSQMYVPVSMSQQVMQQQQQHLQQAARFPAKRAVVSVRPDFNNAAAQAAAATGQPLLAQTMPQQAQYMPYHVGPSGTMPQMMPVAQARMVNPNQMGQPGHPGQDPQMQQGQAQQVYMTGAQAVPTHIQHHPGAGPTPPHQTHMGPQHPQQSVTPQHNQQPSHLANQSAGHHPAQSPVQTHPGHHPHQHHPHHQPPGPHQQHQQQQQQQQHHASSHHPGGQHQHHGVAQQPHPGHPQANQPQHLIYPNPQMNQPPHPPLQPSPHTPTSPQSMHPQQLSFAPPFSYTSQAAIQGGPQLSYAHNHQHTTVTHAQHQHAHAPQIIIPMPPPQGQMTPTGAPPTHMHGPPQGPMMQAAGPVHGQAGPHMVPQNAMGVASSNMHPQIHYMSHHPQMSSQHPQSLPAAYQHSQ